MSTLIYSFFRIAGLLRGLPAIVSPVAGSDQDCDCWWTWDILWSGWDVWGANGSWYLHHPFVLFEPEDLHCAPCQTPQPWKRILWVQGTQSLTFWLRQGAQGVTIFVRPSVVSLSKVLNLHLSLIVLSQICHVSLRSVSGQSQVSLRSLCAYFIRQTEPKILCLVINYKNQIYFVKLCYNTGKDSCLPMGLGCWHQTCDWNQRLLRTVSRAPEPPLALPCRAVSFSGQLW